MPVLKPCAICQKLFPEAELIEGHGIRHEIEKLIQSDYPDWNDSQYICWDDYSVFRNRYVRSLMEEETGRLERLDKEVLNSIRENGTVSENINETVEDKLSLGDLIADKVASFGGSWNFILSFSAILVVWVLLNTVFILHEAFDPYPFILMNLVLSCLAAFQAPIIMMSQNRQEKKDRLRSENDYKVNLKAEIEIRMLHEKMDHLLLDQWSRMMRIQGIQIDLLEEVSRRGTARPSTVSDPAAPGGQTQGDAAQHGC